RAIGTVNRYHRVGRLRKQWVIVVAAERLGLAEVGHVDDAEAAVPAARPHLVAEAQRMVEPMLAPRPARRLTAGDMLPRKPPTPDLRRPLRIAHVVDDEDVADIACHLG